MEKRAILAIVLSLVVVVVWSILFAPSTPPPTEFDDTAPPGALAPDTQLPTDAVRITEREAPPAVAPGEAVEPMAPEIRERLIQVDTGVALVTLTSRGAGVQMVQFHDYRTGLDDDAAPIEIGPSRGAPTVPLAANVVTDGSLVIPLGRQLFVTDGEDVTLSGIRPGRRSQLPRHPGQRRHRAPGLSFCPRALRLRGEHRGGGPVAACR